MKSPKTPHLSSRKQPQQARSSRLVADILEAAVQVLSREGARRFTTARVAERAGISVGSLYQYFPNKEAILFRLQAAEWRQTGALLQDILADRGLPPTGRLRTLVRAFFRSECEEAALRLALGDAAPLYRDAPETREHRTAGVRQVLAFMREALPQTRPAERARAAEVMMITMEAVGKSVSEDGRPPADVDRIAAVTADMFCAYLDRLNAA
ncbi:TetR family transcriptional regulator [Reyranella sp.]|uniref:TetR family transcriptional regulator n=1 Tax=Reyranella sp. TaxID=1929291 RepID=UPI003D118C29